MGSKLQMSSAYHPQTDDQSKRTIQTLENLLRTSILDHLGVWDEVLSLVEFTYNNSFQSNIAIAPFEALYERRCRTPLCWFQEGEAVLTGPEIIQQTTEKILRRIGPIAYELALPPPLSNLHLVFHDSQLRKYIAKRSHVLEADNIQIREDYLVELQPVRVEEFMTKRPFGKATTFVKVIWDERTGDATWEREEIMKESYPNLFSW
ncbi:uncharacterized protein LOC106778237 [Vigna radiata var. radiata]|uniref:Uncharacterized protein LOC106778237 n=1 Tax=Vigna radiata var. radiata TaxID=3916 RepID=A0A1S3VU06_VIGRR|nr:uncharacterized protein LOC106778237 [Vigna radiata var. radiata]